MNVVLSRVDERLIHGQVMTSWVKKLNINKIILVDDIIAKDDFMREVLTLAAPNGVTVMVLSTDSTYHLLQADSSSDRTMLLFKELKYALELTRQGFSMQRLNIGNIGSAPNRKSITNQVYISQDEKEIIKQLIAHNVFVFIQKMPTDTEIDVAKKI